MTGDLNTRMRRAADALREAPASPPTAPPRPGHSLRTVALVGAAVAVVVGAIALTRPDDAGRDGDLGRGDLATQDAPDLPRLVADWLPEGYELVSAASHPERRSGPFDETDGPMPTYEDYLFGDPDGEDPDARADLHVALAVSSENHTVSLTHGMHQPVTVRGHQGKACSVRDCYGLRANRIGWTEGPGIEVTLASPTLSIEQLVGIAEDMTIESGRVGLGSLPNDTPGPLEEICRTWPDDLSEVRTPPATSVTYERRLDDGTRSHLSQTVAPTAPESESGICALQQVPAEEHAVEVRGHPGTLTVHEASGDCQTSSFCVHATIDLTWEEAPGLEVSMTGSPEAISEEDLLRVAESLRPATAEEWAVAVEAGEGLPYPVDYAPHIPGDAGTSVTTDGMGSAAYLTADGRLCGFVVDVEGKLPEVCGSSTSRMLVLRNRDGEMHTLVGRVPEGTREVAALVDGRAEPMGFSFFNGQGDPSITPEIYALVVDPVAAIAPSQLRFSVDGQTLETLDVDEPFHAG